MRIINSRPKTLWGWGHCGAPTHGRVWQGRGKLVAQQAHYSLLTGTGTGTSVPSPPASTEYGVRGVNTSKGNAITCSGAASAGVLLVRARAHLLVAYCKHLRPVHGTWPG
jgi:hypothetical protein